MKKSDFKKHPSPPAGSPAKHHDIGISEPEADLLRRSLDEGWLYGWRLLPGETGEERVEAARQRGEAWRSTGEAAVVGTLAKLLADEAWRRLRLGGKSDAEIASTTLPPPIRYPDPSEGEEARRERFWAFWKMALGDLFDALTDAKEDRSRPLARPVLSRAKLLDLDLFDGADIRAHGLADFDSFRRQAFPVLAEVADCLRIGGPGMDNREARNLTSCLGTLREKWGALLALARKKTDDLGRIAENTAETRRVVEAEAKESRRWRAWFKRLKFWPGKREDGRIKYHNDMILEVTRRKADRSKSIDGHVRDVLDEHLGRQSTDEEFASFRNSYYTRWKKL